ncbi:hypothetical protein [Legionella micdadei]|uniref:Uncharacterized protein n=1 Tax=Legionella micdadei TaxID=451 RepID=A0A098GAM9_LEGMI|nr:hypothetical protein [Legionella micdadei]ARG96292.1 hypothetical protein B6N58_00535 [Legionella micdadei]ARG99047.1 hypothetical protein B6V88_00535 [Legionella micdadei]KTD29116.1 hypothetical protein Lmic_1036 [Legionella micdadei]NSL19403.1 hypothetical protein [Legionella micdadei]CEG59483.1 exported protein of unknown function [Legionella micdadei]
MKKHLILLHVGLVLASSGFASVPLFPKLIEGKHQSKANSQQKKSHEGYADFSGRWSGVCDNDPEEKTSFTIEQSPDFSSITIDNAQMPIDAISTYGANGNFEAEKNIVHLHWSNDGQQLLGSQLAYYKAGNLSQGGVEIGVGKFSWSIENERLHYNLELASYHDGALVSNTSIHCVYDKE